MRAALAALVVLMPAVAIADSSDDVMLHINGGVEVEGDGNITSTAFRTRLLIGHAFATGPVRPELAAGGTLGLGGLFVPDPRAVSGVLSLSNYTVGPEAQIALQLYDGDTPTTRLYASAAYLRTFLDKRLDMDPVPGVGGTEGRRFGFGVNFARTLVHHADNCHRDCDLLWFIFLPHQLEFSVEQDAGSTRYGATFSWGT